METTTEAHQHNRELTTTEIKIAIAQIEDRLMRVAKAQDEVWKLSVNLETEAEIDNLKNNLRKKYDICYISEPYAWDLILNYNNQKSIIMHLNNLIETLKKRRIRLQVTQETLALLTGVSLRTIKQLEAGKGNPTLETIQKLADVLGLELRLEIKNTSIENEVDNDSI
jgi:DNA-binding XRE family transcriptional regulator